MELSCSPEEVQGELSMKLWVPLKDCSKDNSEGEMNVILSHCTLNHPEKVF